MHQATSQVLETELAVFARNHERHLQEASQPPAVTIPLCARFAVGSVGSLRQRSSRSTVRSQFISPV
jgi:hypothetical protein